MAPVHADISDCGVAHHPRDVTERFFQEGDELRAVHLAAGKSELAMFHRSKAANIAVDSNIVRRVSKYEVCLLAIHKLIHGGSFARISAKKPVTTELPDIAHPGNWHVAYFRHGVFWSAGSVWACFAGLIEGEVDLREAEASDFDIEAIQEIDTGGFEAALIMDELKARGSILLAKGRSLERRRFSIAHELGHFLIPSHRPHADHPFECSLSDFHLLNAKDQNRRRRIEAEANRFAAKLLMPPGRVRKAIGQFGSTLENLVSTAKNFGVSKEAMARAWVDAHREPVAVVISYQGQIQRSYRSEDFPWLTIRKGDQFPDGSVAQDHSRLPGAYSTIDEIEPDVWFDEREATRVLTLSEQVLSQQNGYAIILLHAEFDED